MPIDDHTLTILLTAGEDSSEFQRAAAEFARHPELFRELDQAVLQDAVWFEQARHTLREDGLPETAEGAGLHQLERSVVVEICDSLSGDEPPELERISLDFLETASHPELAGRLGRYDIERVIGTGGMGIVLKAWDTDLHRVVAIKILSPHLATHSSARRRFSREAQAAAAVVHPSVIPIHNVEADSQIPYLVMQYVAGESLQQRVDRLGPLPIADVLRIALQTAAGLSAAHAQGLVHRDIKPANILLEDQVDRVLLSDFGLARTIDDASLTRTGIVAGTPFYMSPEQALGERVDQRSDLFSLGTVMYYMLTGVTPFRAPNAMAVLRRICEEPHLPLQQHLPQLPWQVGQLIDRLLQKDAANRIATAHEAETIIAELLARLQQGRLSCSSPPLWQRFTRLLPDRLARNTARRHDRTFMLSLFGISMLVLTAINLLMLPGLWSDRPSASEDSSTLIPNAPDRSSNISPDLPQPSRRTELTVAELKKLREEYVSFLSDEAEFDRDLQELQLRVQHALSPLSQSELFLYRDEFASEIDRLNSQIRRQLEIDVPADPF